MNLHCFLAFLVALTAATVGIQADPRPANGAREDAGLPTVRLARATPTSASSSNKAANRGEPPRFGPGGFGRRDSSPPAEPGPEISMDAVEFYPDRPLYDESTLRVFFLEFSTPEWNEELDAFYRTDLDIEGTMTVDGQSYEGVGVRIRGNTSSMMVSTDRKRSLNLSIDYSKEDQRLYGYRTLNLLNAHMDPTFVREVLFDHIARNYLPAMRANFVHLVINGRSWGIYVNSQQFNRDFLQEWFDTKKGARWKMPANPGRGGGLAYLGESPEPYREQYELKSAEDEEQAWNDLIEMCRILRLTPVEQLDSVLPAHLSVDQTLWFLAMENVFIDNDGYWIRASDFNLYEDPDGRFHLIPHDNNETFEWPGGPGFPGGPGGSSNLEVDPLMGELDESKPLLFNLLAVPAWRARYLAHVKTLAEVWLDWDKIGPLVRQYQDLIRDVVAMDSRKLYDFEAFEKGATENVERTIGLQPFVEGRRNYLLNHPRLKKESPQILSVALSFPANDQNNQPSTRDPVDVVARLRDNNITESVWLYFSNSTQNRFHQVPMQRTVGYTFVGQIPPQPAGTTVHYYVEARANQEVGTTAFMPRGTEMQSLTYTVQAPQSPASPVVINEIMASNVAAIADPQGDFDDWIELFNRSDASVDLSGMYLSDKPDNPRKWEFPPGTSLPAGGFLLVWADEDGKAYPGLHANFKLSKSGERLLLSDRDDAGNARLDSLQFGAQEDDTALARVPDGYGHFRPQPATPGKANSPKR